MATKYVRCVNVYDADGRLEKDREYALAGAPNEHSRYYYLVGVSGGWLKERFVDATATAPPAPAPPAIKPGDVVRLKSGGPAMTVRNVVVGVVTTDYFEFGGRYEPNFAAHTLELTGAA